MRSDVILKPRVSNWLTKKGVQVTFTVCKKRQHCWTRFTDTRDASLHQRNTIFETPGSSSVQRVRRFALDVGCPGAATHEASKTIPLCVKCNSLRGQGLSGESALPHSVFDLLSFAHFHETLRLRHYLATWPTHAQMLNVNRSRMTNIATPPVARGKKIK